MSIYITPQDELHVDYQGIALTCPHCHTLTHLTPIAVPKFEELSRRKPKNIGIVFQFFNLLEGMSVHENVVMPALIAGTKRKAAESRARDLLDLLGGDLDALLQAAGGGEAVDRLGEIEADAEADEEGDDRPDQPPAQLDQVIHQGRLGRLDGRLVVVGAGGHGAGGL